MQYIEQDGWSDYKRTHGLTFISCFLVQIFSHFLAALDSIGYFFTTEIDCLVTQHLSFTHTYSFSRSLSPFCLQSVGGSE